MQSEQVDMPYEAWRITYQSSEQAARAAHAALQSLGARIKALEGELATLQAGLQAAAPNAPLYDPREVAFSAQAAPQAVQAAVPETREALAKRLIADVQVADTIATAACQRVADLPDRDSPADWPEAMLVTGDELHMIVREAVIEAQAAPAHPAEGVPAQASREAVIQHLTNAGVLEHDGCGVFIASGVASELIDACMTLPLSNHPTQQGMDAREGRTDAEIVERTEAAARFLLSWAFSQEPEDAKAQLRHSQNTKAQSAWVAACKVQEILTDSDAANAAQEIDCDLPVVPKLPDARPKPRLHDFEIIGHFVSAEMKHKSDELADSVAWLKSRDTICANKNGFGCEHSCKPGACCQIAAQAKQGGAA